MRVGAGGRQREPAAEQGPEFELSTIDLGIAGVVEQRITEGQLLQLDLCPVLIVEAGVDGKMAVKKAGLFANLIAPEGIGFIGGWPRLIVEVCWGIGGREIRQ